jgi:hypothetical protein
MDEKCKEQKGSQGYLLGELTIVYYVRFICRLFIVRAYHQLNAAILLLAIPLLVLGTVALIFGFYELYRVSQL